MSIVKSTCVEGQCSCWISLPLIRFVHDLVMEREHLDDCRGTVASSRVDRRSKLFFEQHRNVPRISGCGCVIVVFELVSDVFLSLILRNPRFVDTRRRRGIVQ